MSAPNSNAWLHKKPGPEYRIDVRSLSGVCIGGCDEQPSNSSTVQGVDSAWLRARARHRRVLDQTAKHAVGMPGSEAFSYGGHPIPKIYKHWLIPACLLRSVDSPGHNRHSSSTCATQVLRQKKLFWVGPTAKLLTTPQLGSHKRLNMHRAGPYQPDSAWEITRYAETSKKFLATELAYTVPIQLAKRAPVNINHQSPIFCPAARQVPYARHT